MVWVQRIIWVVLAVFSVGVLYVVFSGGVVEDAHVDREHLENLGAGSRGTMAYDRYLPGGRQNAAEAESAP